MLGSFARTRTPWKAVVALLLAGVILGGCKKKDHSETPPFPDYGPPRPVLTSVVPGQGFLGDSVTIVGANFDPLAANNVISFNGGTTTPSAGETSVLVCTIPFGASTGPLTVNTNGQGSNALPFTVLGGPLILSLTPSVGPLGTIVTLDGLNFSPVPEENTILFDFDGSLGVATPTLAVTQGRLTCYAPAGAETGPVIVRVGGLDSNAVLYTYTTVQVTDVAPRSGVVTDPVTITGENFSPVPSENLVRFNGVQAPCLASAADTIQTEVPSGATGGLVTVETAGHKSNGIYFCVWTPAPAAPAITDVLPGQGAAGDSVVIQGSNFAPNTTDNEVRFCGVLATVTGATGTTIDAVVPDGARSGPVTVQRGSDVATAPADFTVTSPGLPPPVLDRLNPAAAPQQRSIVIEGSGFHTVPANNRVTFSAEPAKVIAATPVALLVEVPRVDSGVVTVQVADQVSNGLSFTVQGPPPGASTLSFFGSQISAPSDSVIYVVDLSLSMDVAFGSYVDRFGQTVSGTRLDVVRDRLAYSISELAPHFRFNIVVYAGDADRTICADHRFWQPTPQVATLANKTDGINWLNSWATWLWTATTMAVEGALQNDPTNRTICLITDGRWTCPLNESNADQLCRMFNANPQNAEIHTVAIQVSGGFSNLLRDISFLTGGTFVNLDPPLGWPK